MQRNKELFLQSSCMVPSFARGMKILLVDRDTTSLLCVASMLEQFSFEVTTTELASIALSMIQQEKDRFQLLMANFDISDRNSLLFFRLFLKENIPVILISSKTSEVVSQRALVEGACFVLEKPISFDDLKYVWQHVYKRRIQIALEMNHGNISQCMRISAEDDDDDDDQNYQMEVGAHEVFILDESSSVQESHNNCMEHHLITANDQIQNQGGSFKTKRSLLDDDDDDDNEGDSRNENKRKGNSDYEYSNNIMTPIEEKGEEMNSYNIENAMMKKRRMIWTPELHLKFTEAVNALGYGRARPKQIRQMMNVPGLTQRQIASHLQKYKSKVQQGSTDLSAATSISLPSSIYASYSMQFEILEKIQPSVAYLPTFQSNIFAAEGITQAGGFVQVEHACQNQLSSKYFADMLKCLEEDEYEKIKAGLVAEPNQAEIDRYSEWLKEAI